MSPAPTVNGTRFLTISHATRHGTHPRCSTAMVADPCDYACSSHRCHGAGHADLVLDSFPEWEQLGRTEPERRARWRRRVRGEQPCKELDAVRSSLRSGRPFGVEDWVEITSRRLGIVREQRRRGRPPHEKRL